MVPIRVRIVVQKYTTSISSGPVQKSPSRIRVWKNQVGQARGTSKHGGPTPCRLLAGLFPGDAFAYKELLEDSGAVVQLTQGHPRHYNR